VRVSLKLYELYGGICYLLASSIMAVHSIKLKVEVMIGHYNCRVGIYVLSHIEHTGTGEVRWS